MKKTLLRIVQDILYDMDSDEINSIGDTVESTQVARKVENVFWDVVSRLSLPKNSSLIELASSEDVGLPNIMYVPENVLTIESLKYYNRDVNGVYNWNDVEYVPYNDFIRGMYSVDPTQTNIKTVTLTLDGGHTFKFYPYKDRGPTYFTSFDDHTLIFDAYDESIDLTLVSDKTTATGKVSPTFEQNDAFIPPLDPETFNLFFFEAKQACFADMKQIENADAGRRSRKSWIKKQVDRATINDPYANFRDTPDYGRSRGGLTLRSNRNSW